VQSVSLSRRAILLSLIAMMLAGCGDSTHMSTTASTSARAPHRAPAYRVGQYCLPSREAKYRAAGLTCTSHHLVRLLPHDHESLRRPPAATLAPTPASGGRESG